uniref:Uncharacterized protein n=1 Tax=Panagrolaimus sp. PS1159 TaxID=55785 RepID=A0AC35EUB0_9BILA
MDTYYDLSGAVIDKPRFSPRADVEDVRLDEGRFTLDCFITEISPIIKVNTSNGVKKMVKAVFSCENNATFPAEIWQPHVEPFIETCVIGTCMRISFVPKQIYGNLFQAIGQPEWHCRINLDTKITDIPPPGKNIKRRGVETSNRGKRRRAARDSSDESDSRPKCRREKCGKKKRRESSESDSTIARQSSKRHPLQKSRVRRESSESDSTVTRQSSKRHPLQKRPKKTESSDSESEVEKRRGSASLKKDKIREQKDDKELEKEKDDEVEARIKQDKSGQSKEETVKPVEPSSSESDDEADDDQSTESDDEEIPDTQKI